MWTCSKCKRKFLRVKQSHSCVVFPLKNHFQGKEQVARPLFDELVKKIRKYAGPLTVDSVPCCIHLVHGQTFAAVWALKDKIRVDFRLDENIKDPRIFRKVKMSPNRYLYYLDIREKSRIDKKLLYWIKESYKLSMRAARG